MLLGYRASQKEKVITSEEEVIVETRRAVRERNKVIKSPFLPGTIRQIGQCSDEKHLKMFLEVYPFLYFSLPEEL